MENIPEASCIFVANHNIGACVEISALIDAWDRRFNDRSVYGLTHPFAFKIPLFRNFVRALGSIPATYESAYQTLAAGSSFVVFPGGNWEAARPFSQRKICDFGNHYGWAKIAFQSKRRVVPISISGSHSVNPVLLRSRRLVSILVIPKLLGLSSFPVTVGQLLLSIIAFLFLRMFATGLPLAVSLLISYFVFICTTLTPIWPSKIQISFGKPIDLEELSKNLKTEDEKLKLAYREVMSKVQEGMDRHQSRTK
jgi:1-acyl-sn-glycerol-3-phosphate acyltransferase